MKNKYIDNMLAEELDTIVLTTDKFKKRGLKRGCIGTLIDSYTRHDKPLCGQFEKGDKRLELDLGLHDFRVVDPSKNEDLKLLFEFLRGKKAI